MQTFDAFPAPDAAPDFPHGTCVALGLFDGVHIGHQAVIDAAVRMAGERGLTPALFTFTTSGSRPGKKPTNGRLMSPEHFERVVAKRGIEAVFRPAFEAFRNLTPAQFVREMLAGWMGAKALVCGYDFRFGKGAAGNPQRLGELAGALDIPLEVVPAVTLGGEEVSSTCIRARVHAGEMEAARRLLGRPYAIDFEVIHGNHIGHTLGWPTINQPFPADFTIPRFGVYATVAIVDGVRHSAVTNVGVKPTVGSDATLAETYIQGYSGNLYEKRVLVEFLDFVRPEQKFESLDALRGQIQRDAATADRLARVHMAGQ